MKAFYIAGAVTGIPGDNAKSFRAAEIMLTRLGYQVYNPIPIGRETIARVKAQGKGYPTHVDFMRDCIPYLCKSDFIFMLPGWESSRGARWEWLIAKHVLQVSIYENIDEIPGA